MRVSKRSFLCTVCCAAALSLPWSVAAQQAQVEPSSAAQATSLSSATTLKPTESVTEVAAAGVLPDSPGAEWAKAQQSTAPQSDSSQAGQAQAGQSNSQEKPQRPVGTAAAEAPRVTGITAAEPAGVAIAPAKQHRVRIIVLKVGAIVGASAALGTVIALTAGTASKPPGAH